MCRWLIGAKILVVIRTIFLVCYHQCVITLLEDLDRDLHVHVSVSSVTYVCRVSFNLHHHCSSLISSFMNCVFVSVAELLSNVNVTDSTVLIALAPLQLVSLLLVLHEEVPLWPAVFISVQMVAANMSCSRLPAAVLGVNIHVYRQRGSAATALRLYSCRDRVKLPLSKTPNP